MLVQLFVDLEGYSNAGIFRIETDKDENDHVRSEVGKVSINE